MRIDHRPPSPRRAIARLGTACAVSYLLVIAPGLALAAPTVAVTTPTSGQTVYDALTLAVSASDPAGISQVKWYVDGGEVGWDASAPFTAAWDSHSVADGTHSIFAKAMNPYGTWGTSPLVSFTVANNTGTSTLRVSVTAPLAGATVSGSAVELAATTSDDSRADQMKWFVDNVEVGWDGTAPWSDSWSTTSLTDGPHVMFAKALDSATGAWVTSGTVSVTVKNLSTSNPDGGTAPANWSLVLSDDFDGTSLDLTKWFTYGPNWPGNLGIGLRDGRAVSVANGVMTITAQWLNGVIVTGAISTRLYQMYGRWEFRVRTDTDATRTVSGAILTWPKSERWPVDGENDIYETLNNSSRSPFYTFIHYDVSNQQYYYLHQADASQWHHIAMEWEPSAIRIYRDGALVYTLTDTYAIPDTLHRLAIQLDPFTPFLSGPVKMQVDNVRIYARP